MKFDNDTYIVCQNNFIYKVVECKYAFLGLFVDEINYMKYIDFPNNIQYKYLDLNGKEFKLLNINIELSCFMIKDLTFCVDFKNKIIFNSRYVNLIEKSISHDQTIKLTIENGKIIKKEKILFNKQLVLNDYCISLFSDSEYF